MDIDILAVPYDSGTRDVRMGRGPGRLLDFGLPGALEDDGHTVRIRTLESTLVPPAEIASAFGLARSLSAAVADARVSGRFPLVLAGNCFSALGTVSGLGGERVGVLWFDAHGDLNTPDTTVSGLLDGMALSTLTGRCWRELASTVPGFRPLHDLNLLLLGARDLDRPETALTSALGIARVGCEEIRSRGPGRAAQERLGRMGESADRFYAHVDLDVLDPGVAPVSAFSTPAGLTAEEVVDAVTGAATIRPVEAAAIASYDPAYDIDDRAAAAAVTIARGIIRGAESALHASGSATAPVPPAPGPPHGTDPGRTA